MVDPRCLARGACRGVGAGLFHFLELALHGLQVAPDELLHRIHVPAGLAQHVCRMEGHDQIRSRRPRVPNAALASDAEASAQERLRCGRSERQDDARSDDRDLAVEILTAVRDLFLHRRAIGNAPILFDRCPAFDRIGDEHIVACQTDGREHAGQQFPGAADERLALAIFVLAGSLADDHQRRIGIADPADDLGARAADEASAARIGLRVQQR